MTAPTHFSAHGFAFVAGFRADPGKDVRRHLAGVHASPHPRGGVLLAATNGHQLASYFDATGSIGEPRLFAAGRGLVAACRARDADRVHIVDERLVCHRRPPDHRGGELFHEPAQDLETFVQPGRADLGDLIGYYPAWLKLLPDPKLLHPGALGVLNALYLAKAATAAAWLFHRSKSRRYVPAITHWSKGGDGRGLVVTRIAGLDHAIVCTMPTSPENVPPLPDFALTLKA